MSGLSMMCDAFVVSLLLSVMCLRWFDFVGIEDCCFFLLLLLMPLKIAMLLLLLLVDLPFLSYCYTDHWRWQCCCCFFFWSICLILFYCYLGCSCDKTSCSFLSLETNCGVCYCFAIETIVDEFGYWVLDRTDLVIKCWM